jgi:hypothetical protein
MNTTTTNIVRALRNSTTPAASLAAWQNNGVRRNLATLRKHAAPGYPCRPCNFPENPSASDWRKALVNDPAFKRGTPEMSSPEADAPLLWLSGESDPEVLDCWAGRKFLDHRGWYTMDDMSQETIETYAVRLRRFPKLIFYATHDSMSDGFCLHLQDWEEIDFSDCESDYDAQEAITETARSVIRGNDSTTERNAEDQREFYEQDQREQEIERNREELAGVRESARRLIRELRELCPTLGGKYPAAAEAVQGALKGLLRERRELIARNEKLANA